jgi:hypothetical protein
MRETQWDRPKPEVATRADGAIARVPLAASPIGTPAAGTLLALQHTIGNRRLSRLVAARAPGRTLQRYKILGPWNKGQAVHETLTVLAVGRAIATLKAMGKPLDSLLSSFDTSKLPQLDKKFDFDPEYADASFAQFIRGVVWADDPEGLLFDKDEDTSDYSSGLEWYSAFSAGEKGQFKPNKADLIPRSHFGDLQFFHGMASADNELPAVTKGKMLNWARFLVNVATGRLSPNTKVKDVAEIKDLFPANAEWSVKQLFVYAKATDVQARQRAVGVLFHMIQDSFAHGHVQRDPASDDIQEFHAYGSQDESSHAGYDKFGKGKNLGEQIAHTVGAPSAMQRCSEVLVKIAVGLSTDEIVDYLDSVVFKLAPDLFFSGPGGGLGKKGTTTTDKPVPKPPSGDFPVPSGPDRPA